MFTEAEGLFLESIGRGRLVTVGPDDAPQIHSVPFTVDLGSGSVEISGARLRNLFQVVDQTHLSVVVPRPKLRRWSADSQLPGHLGDRLASHPL